MRHEAPIYDQLVRELGDIPMQVRSIAERTVRDLEQVLGPVAPLAGGHGAPGGYEIERRDAATGQYDTTAESDHVTIVTEALT